MTADAGAAIPIDVHPDPVLAYTVSDGTARVTATNDAFRATFDTAPVGSPVSAVFDQFQVVETAGDGDPHEDPFRGEATRLYLDGVGEDGRYLVRTVPIGGEGYLVFSPLGEVLELAETAGVGQVASVLSHDLRNPLDVATAHLRAARETGDPEHFDAVAGAHDRMQTIIRDVLTLARGREAIDPSGRIAIRSAVEDAWNSVDTGDATLDVSGSLPTAVADADRVRRLFENLFRNAVEHGSAGDGTASGGDVATGTGPEDAVESAEEIRIRVGGLDDGFYVADDGPGVPEAEREAVFDPGYSTSGGGAGLGLAIVDRIVAAHGWEIEVTAARDGGARFEVQF
jgi:signal transduction histidine kinase